MTREGAFRIMMEYEARGMQVVRHEEQEKKKGLDATKKKLIKEYRKLQKERDFTFKERVKFGEKVKDIQCQMDDLLEKISKYDRSDSDWESE